MNDCKHLRIEYTVIRKVLISDDLEHGHEDIEITRQDVPKTGICNECGKRVQIKPRESRAREYTIR